MVNRADGDALGRGLEVGGVIADIGSSIGTTLASSWQELAAVSSMRWLRIDAPQVSTSWDEVHSEMAAPVLWSKAHVQSVTCAQTEAVEAMREALAAMDESMLAYGSRMDAIRQAFDSCSEYADERIWALSALMDLNAPEFADERLAAAIRYLGIYDVPDVEISSIVRLLTKALRHGSREELSAAAMSLRDIGDSGAIPAIVYALQDCRDEGLSSELQKTIDSLVFQHGSG